MAMAEACRIFEALGFNNVHSVLATGNIIFTINRTKSTLKKIIGKVLMRRYPFAIDVFVKNSQEIQNIFNFNSLEIRKEMYIQTFVFNDGFKILLREKLNEIPFLAHVKKSMFARSHFFKILSRNTLKYHSHYGRLVV
ncbi:MAG: DUF1697 domain-containing protein [Puniceicoccales bacterium]|jgi:uncharacterized protein (DUF1697 family)|nr:DUF1697 domain-containing protein [Puniceicoccales bacterium]